MLAFISLNKIGNGNRFRLFYGLMENTETKKTKKTKIAKEIVQNRFITKTFYLNWPGAAPNKPPLCLLAARDGAKPSNF